MKSRTSAACSLSHSTGRRTMNFFEQQHPRLLISSEQSHPSPYGSLRMSERFLRTSGFDFNYIFPLREMQVGEYALVPPVRYLQSQVQ